MGTGGELIVAWTLGSGTGVVGMQVGACTLCSVTGTGYGVSVAVGGRGVGAGMDTVGVVAWRIICVICM